MASQNRDYYIENGNYVFTEEFLARRGYCCGNGCRHCPYVFDQKSFKVVSLVPSWTETLAACGIEIIGKTRFCVHPKNELLNVMSVGGTKDCSVDKIRDLKPDAIILDKEENTREMALSLEAIGKPVLVTHVTDNKTLLASLIKLNQFFKSSAINQLIQKTTKILAQSNVEVSINRQFPGILEWISAPEKFANIDRLVYVIWRDPWMRVTDKTFIGSQLQALGYRKYLQENEPQNNRYPTFELDDYNLSTTLFLFSSEPYPFHRKKDELKKLGVYCAIVDGESYSWFGVRGLKFVENHLGLPST